MWKICTYLSAFGILTNFFPKLPRANVDKVQCLELCFGLAHKKISEQTNVKQNIVKYFFFKLGSGAGSIVCFPLILTVQSANEAARTDFVLD